MDLDGLALFHADHGNLGSGSLGPGSLAAACAAIRRQVIVTTEDSDSPQIQHLNLQPRFLVVPPELESLAQELLRLRTLDDIDLDLRLRVESRLSNIGVRNPLDGSTATGSTTNWLLTCDNTVAPWLLRGYLSGQDEPKVRSSQLSPKVGESGQWGLAVDIAWPIAVKAADFRGCYFSTGTN